MSSAVVWSYTRSTDAFAVSVTISSVGSGIWAAYEVHGFGAVAGPPRPRHTDQHLYAHSADLEQLRTIADEWIDGAVSALERATAPSTEARAT